MGNQTTKSPFDVQILAARLKDLMRESVPKVTQKDLAAALGTAPNMVSAYMHGKSCPSLPMAVNIAQYFDVSIDYLAGLTDQRQQVIVSAPPTTPAPTPKRGRDPWRKMAVCNSCDWRRRMAAPCGDWDGTACMYTHEPGFFANRRRRKTAAHIIKAANAEWAAKTAKVKPQHHDNTKGD